MLRKIIRIDEEKCNGCGACATACHEGAIKMIDGKAKLIREDYCDGLGDCLPTCPVNAISFEERDAKPYSETAVKEAQNKLHSPHINSTKSRLSQWPCQIKLVPENAPYFDEANLLIAADCTAYAYANFHEEFMKNHITLIGCPKLDGVDYCEKLARILKLNSIKSIQLLRMEVPCCSGLEVALRKALNLSGKNIPLKATVISTDGKILQ